MRGHDSNPWFKKPDKSGIGLANRVMLRTGYFGRRKGYLRANILNNAVLLAMLRTCVNKFIFANIALLEVWLKTVDEIKKNPSVYFCRDSGLLERMAKRWA